VNEYRFGFRRRIMQNPKPAPKTARVPLQAKLWVKVLSDFKAVFMLYKRSLGVPFGVPGSR